jgi:SAC3 family protein LENG8/THP3
VKGTCQTLEKAYFRLTSAPDPADVRPEEVLEKSLKLMSKKWKKREADYRYIDEQFRSMRQDLTVQRIQNGLTVRVYETHARIALEQADLDQFNQCQTQLHYLYDNGVQGN